MIAMTLILSLSARSEAATCDVAFTTCVHDVAYGGIAHADHLEWYVDCQFTPGFGKEGVGVASCHASFTFEFGNPQVKEWILPGGLDSYPYGFRAIHTLYYNLSDLWSHAPPGATGVNYYYFITGKVDNTTTNEVYASDFDMTAFLDF
jgi:hypothetical protein